MEKATPQPPSILTIGGSDPCGAFGIQADLKTFTAVSTYGMSVITAVTAQNSVGFYGVHDVPVDMVRQQLEAVLSDYKPAAVKTGFLGRADLVEAIASLLKRHQVKNLVVDPVLVNGAGEQMFDVEVTAAYFEHLLPLATLITPNRHELGVLLEIDPEEVKPKRALEQLHLRIWPNEVPILLKGVPSQNEMVDLLFDGNTIHRYHAPRTETQNVSGSGDTLSAAIAAYIGQGFALKKAIFQAHAFTHHAIEAAAGWQLGRGPGPLAHLPAT